MNGLISAVRRSVAGLDPGIETEFHVFETSIREGMERERLMAALAGFFGALAALLAGIGLYGVMSYMVVRRRHEMGIRAALGANRGQLVGMILREAALLVAAGAGAGLGLAAVAARSARALLFGLGPHDPATLIAAGGSLAVIALLATYVPAFRAARVDPMSALRDE